MLHSLDDLGRLVEDLAPQRAFEVSSGLPWQRTLAELESAYGVTSWRGFLDVVPIPDPALGLTAGFRHRFDPARRHYPANLFEAEVNPHGEHRANHEWAVRKLEATFRGMAPVRSDVSNCLRAYWEFGLFEVMVRSFLPVASTAAAAPNPLHDRYPDLAVSSRIAVESRLCAYREPDASLDLRDGLLVPAKTGWGDFLTNRLLPIGLGATLEIPAGQTRLWRDHGRGRVGAASRWATVVVPLTGAVQLRLDQRSPARGPGSAALRLNHTTILVSDAWDGLRAIAADAAAFYGLPLGVDTRPDE